MAKFAAAMVLVGAAILYIYQLGHLPLNPYDEQTYAGVVEDCVYRGSCVSPTIEGKPYLEKPPLYFWIDAALVAVFGESNFMLRLPSALAGVGCVLLVICIVWPSNKLWAVVGGLLLAVTPMFVVGARTMLLDVLLAFFILLSINFLLQGRGMMSGVSAGFAILTKSVLGLFALVPMFMLLIVAFIKNPTKSALLAPAGFDIAQVRSGMPKPAGLAARPGLTDFFRMFYSSLIALAVALPWHLYQTYVYSTAFWQDYLGTQVFSRYSSNLFGSGNAPAELWPIVLLLGAPLLLAPWLWKRFTPYERQALLYCGSILVCLGLVFVTSATRAYSYLLPLYPLAAVSVAIVGAGVHRWFSAPMQD